MKRFIIGFFIVFASYILIPTALVAQDGVFSDAQALERSEWSLGIQPAIYTELNNDLMLIFRGAYGLRSDITFHGKVGVLRDETYAGGHFLYQVAGEPEDPMAISLLFGAYSFGDIGLKLGSVISKQIGTVSIYSGLTYEPLFSDPALTPLMLPLGVDIPLGTDTHFLFEADVGINDDGEAYQALHSGVKFYLR